MIWLLMTFTVVFLSHAQATNFTDLLPYVQEAPDQGKTGTCLFMASTGAIELLANQKYGIKKPVVGGKFDLSEPYLIHAPKKDIPKKSFFEKPIYRFNSAGFGVHISDWPFFAWIGDGTEVNRGVWTEDRDITPMRKIELPKIRTKKLFNKNNRYATNVLEQEHVDQVKEALIKWNAPVMINYKDNRYWHVILIVGFDDEKEGECYQITEEECKETSGSFYVRDSFGKRYESRDYDWFRIKANAAFVVYSPEKTMEGDDIEEDEETEEDSYEDDDEALMVNYFPN